jgi:Ca2+-binding EF-hand superfamily protein
MPLQPKMANQAQISQIARLRDKGLSADKIDEYKAAFDLFDFDGTGRITAGALRAHAAVPLYLPGLRGSSHTALALGAVTSACCVALRCSRGSSMRSALSCTHRRAAFLHAHPMHANVRVVALLLWHAFQPRHDAPADKLGYVLNTKFGQNFGGEDLNYMLRQFGDSGDVDFYTFAVSLHEKMGDPRYSEAFGDAFDLFDVAKTGELTREDLQTGMAKLGENLTESEAAEMLKIAKKKDDFVRAMVQGGGGGGGAGGSSGGAAGAPAAAGGAPAAAGAAPSAGAAAGPAAPTGPAAPMVPGIPMGGPPRPAGAPGACAFLFAVR